MPFFNGEQDLPRFPKFVKQIECCSAEIALKTAVSLYMNEQFGTWIDDDGGLYYDT